ncbi:MAG TPA: hypothetical protein VFR60_04475 [Sphingomicrobium sp.]|nr:hypothetical protein [Sphingomicrobium sp.]
MVGFALLAALFAAQGAPEPQASAPPSSDEIIVEGVRQPRERVRQFIRSLDDVPSFGQIGKFHTPVCPAVMGFPDAQNLMVAERMKRVAQAAGIRVGDSECAPNVFLIASVDKGATIDALYRSYPAYFRDMAAKDVRKLIGSKEASVAWQIKGLLSADGTVLKKSAMGGPYINEGTNSGSRIRAGTMPEFVASMVMVERSTLTGLSVTQVGDFAAMRAFADTDPHRAAASGAPTILTILDKAGDQMVPLTLTHWDLGYLKSLYATSNAYYASYQRGDMEHELVKELSKGR